MTRFISLCLCLTLLLAAGCSAGTLWSSTPSGTEIADKSDSTQRLSGRNRHRRSHAGEPSATASGSIAELETGYPELTLVFNRDVEKFIHEYQTRGRRTLQQALDRRRSQIQTVAEEFDKLGVPIELSNLAIIESGFNPNSRGKGTLGLWQFTAQTARDYGLEVKKKKDQRVDIRKSSGAAAELLADLYDLYGDWYLVLAAYNCGRFRLERGIKATGERDYFKIKNSRGFSKTTGDFVPRFIAITMIMRSPEKFGFTL